MQTKNKQSGFTIVELLIVIVVIGILAAITIVAYNGIQQRANNQQMTTAVRAYYTALQKHVIDNGSLPTQYACLGPEQVYDSNPCYHGSSSPYVYSQALNDALAPYIGNPPTVPNKSISNKSTVTPGLTSSGIFYYFPGSYIGFPMQGTNTCPTIAGVAPRSTTPIGPDVYCTIKTPAV